MGLEEIRGEIVLHSNIGSNIEVAKSQTFDRVVGKISGFIIVYKLFIKMKMRKIVVEKQI